MVKRLFLVLNRDLIRLETAQIKMPVERGPDGSPVPDDLENVAPVIAKRERLVANMQRTMERLAGMETGRSPARNQSRKKKAASANDNTLEKLECRIASLVEAARDPEDSSGSDA